MKFSCPSSSQPQPHVKSIQPSGLLTVFFYQKTLPERPKPEFTRGKQKAVQADKSRRPLRAESQSRQPTRVIRKENKIEYRPRGSAERQSVARLSENRDVELSVKQKGRERGVDGDGGILRTLWSAFSTSRSRRKKKHRSSSSCSVRANILLCIEQALPPGRMPHDSSRLSSASRAYGAAGSAPSTPSYDRQERVLAERCRSLKQ